MIVRAAHHYPADYEHSDTEIDLTCDCHPQFWGGCGLRTGLHEVGDVDHAVYVLQPTQHQEVRQHYVVLHTDGSLERVK